MGTETDGALGIAHAQVLKLREVAADDADRNAADEGGVLGRPALLLGNPGDGESDPPVSRSA